MRLWCSAKLTPLGSAVCACAPPSARTSSQDIFRRYPNQYETIIAQLCDNLESLDEPEAKASMIWIIGEYAERIDNADELLETFLETFPEETSMVRVCVFVGCVFGGRRLCRHPA